jgi:hypothetical protein
VPVSVLLALAVIQQRTLADVSVTVAMRVMGDPKSDPDFRHQIYRYYGEGRAAIPLD